MIRRARGLLGLMASLATAPLVATDYYVAMTGDDSNPGTAGAPWRTIARVNNADLQPGDRVLFRRGDNWAETLHPSASGAPGTPIVYADYGNGPRPVLSGEPNNHCISWSSTRSHLVFRQLHLQDCGQPDGSTRGALASWNDGEPSREIVLEDSLLENAQTWNIYLTGVDGLRIRRNTIRNAEQQHGIYLDGERRMADVVIEGNDIYGNAGMCVQLNSNGQNRLSGVVLRYNRLHDCSYGGLNNIGVDGLLAHHNLIYGAMPGIYNSCDSEDMECRYGATDGLYLHNTIITTGEVWATCFLNGSENGNPNFAAFVNNICIHNAEAGPAFTDEEYDGGAWVDYNLYFSTRSVPLRFVWQDVAYENLDRYRELTGNEEEGLFANPGFVDPFVYDLRLTRASPAVDSAIDLGFEYDSSGYPIPAGEGPDRGALEFRAEQLLLTPSLPIWRKLGL